MKDKEKQAIAKHWLGEDEATYHRDKRGGYRLQCEDDVYHLIKGEKRDPYFENIVALRRCLEQEGFERMPKLVAARDDSDIFVGREGVYALEEMVEYQSFSLGNEQHIAAAGETLAAFHQLSCCGEGNLSFRSRHLGSLCRDFEQLLAEAELAYADLVEEDEDAGLASLLKGEGKELLARSERGLIAFCASPYGQLCEKRESNGGVIYGSGGFGIYDDEVWLTDFSNLEEDIPVIDLWRFLRRLAGRHGGQRNIEDFLERYERIRPLSDEEWKVLYSLLSFGYYPLRLLRRLAREKRRERGKSVALAAKLHEALVIECRKKDFYRWVERRRDKS